MCGDNIYYKVTIPSGWRCDIKWEITVPSYQFGYDTLPGASFAMYSKKILVLLLAVTIVQEQFQMEVLKPVLFLRPRQGLIIPM